MFRKMLVPIDLADRTLPAIETVVELAASTGATIRLLHVIEPIPGVDGQGEEEFFGRLEAKAHEVIKKLGARLQEAEVEWDGEVVYGSRAARIVERAAEMEADLIILASHRIDLDKPGGGWGTVSYKVAILADCPVMLIK